MPNDQQPLLASAYWDYARKAVVSQSVTAPFLLSEQEQQAAADMLACYQAVPWLFRAVQMRCDAVSKMPFRITKKGSTSKEAYDDSANYQNKLGFLPNPTRLFWLIEAASSFWGSAYLWRSYNARRVLGLRYLLPPTITPEIDEDQGLTGFTRYLNGQPKAVTTADIVYLWRPDPFVEIGPPLSSPVSAALSAANVLLNVDLFAAAFFQRGAIKATLLTVEGNPPKAEKEALKSWWERVIGGIRNAFSTEVVSANVTPVQIGEGINDLANTTLTDEKRSEIAVALGVPQSVIHSGSATGLGGGGVARQDDKHFYDKTVVPECGWLQAELNEQVFQPEGFHLEFTPEVLEIYQAEEAALARSFQLYVDIGLPKSLAAQMVGIELPPGWKYEDLDKMEAPEGKDAAGKDAADDEKRKEEQAERAALEGAGKPANDDAKALPGDDDDDDAAKGGAGSGNWGHEGRPGVRGGSKPGGGAHMRQTVSAPKTPKVKIAPMWEEEEEAVKAFGLTMDDIAAMTAWPGDETDIETIVNVAAGNGYVELSVRWVQEGRAEAVGVMERNLSTNDDGSKSSDHSLLEINKNFQGRDIADKLYNTQFDVYRRVGISKVSLEADISIGRYAWARRGFQYKSAAGGQEATARFKDWCNAQGVKLKTYPKFKTPQDVANFKAPGAKVSHRDISNPDIKHDDYDLGKAFLLDLSPFGHGRWDGVLDI